MAVKPLAVGMGSLLTKQFQRIILRYFLQQKYEFAVIFSIIGSKVNTMSFAINLKMVWSFIERPLNIDTSAENT